MVFDVGFDQELATFSVHLILNYSCFPIDFYTSEEVLKIEDAIYKTINEFVQSVNINNTMTLPHTLRLNINTSDLIVVVVTDVNG